MDKRKNTVESFQKSDVCPDCLEPGMKTWDELSDEQQFLVKRLPASAEYTLKERKKHRFCERCWFEEKEPPCRDV